MGEIAEKVGMGPFGSSIKVDTFVPDGVPIISGQHLHGHRVDHTPGFNFITEEHATRLANAVVGPGDIVLTHRGTIGQAAYVPPDSRYDRYVVSQSQFYLRCDRSKAIPEFVAAYFKSPEGRHKLLANASQVGVPAIAQPVSYLRTIDLPLPSLAEQRTIAHILGSLEDKIELNRRVNDTLEATARGMFKSWFVDFEPVRAKMAGRDTGLPQSISDLFPSGMVQAEALDVPVGWCTGTLADVARVRRHNVTPADCGDQTPYIGLGDMPRRSIALGSWGSAGSVKSAKSRFEKGDILFGKLRPYFHKVGIAPIDGVCSSDIVVIVPKSPEWSAFVSAAVSSDHFVNYTNRTSTGTKMPRTSWKTMGQYAICIPPSDLLAAYQEKVQPLLDRVVVGIHTNISLVALRDALLPKLLSGELRVPDAERIAAAVI